MNKEQADEMRAKIAEYDKEWEIVHKLTKAMNQFHNNGVNGLVSGDIVTLKFRDGDVVLEGSNKAFNTWNEILLGYEHVPDIGKKINEFLANLFCGYLNSAMERLKAL